MLTAPGLFRSNLYLAYVYRVLVCGNDFQQSGSIRRQCQQHSRSSSGGTTSMHFKISLYSKELFDGNTHVDWEQRMKLKDNSLAKFLHGFYATHAAPLRYKVETIKELSGSTTERLTDFRKALRIALEKLKGVGAITSWAIDPKSDLVTVRRKGSVSQQRHLESKQEAKASAEFADNRSGTLTGFDSYPA